MNPNLYKSILMQSPNGYAYHKILCDDEGKPVDYEFIEVNEAFKELTGLKDREIIGKRITELIPGFKESSFDWIKMYGDIAKNGGTKEFEQYADLIHRWYRVNVFSPEKEHFVTIFSDISKEKLELDQLERFFSVNIDLLCIMKRDGSFLKANKEWENVLGHSLNKIESRNLFDYLHPDDIESTKAQLSNLNKQQKVLRFINRYRHKDRTFKYLEWNATPYGDLIYAASRDITDKINEKNKLEQMVGISEEFLQADAPQLDYQKITDDFLNISGAKYVIFNLYAEDGEIFTTTAISGDKGAIQRASELLGFKLVGKAWNHDPVRSQKIKKSTITKFNSIKELSGDVVPQLLAAMLGNIFHIGEIAVVKISRNDVMLGDFSLFMPKGKHFEKSDLSIVYTRQLGTLISRKRAERKLVELQERFERYISHAPVGIFIADNKGEYTHVNNAACLMTGYTKEELIGISVFDLVYEDDRDTAIKSFLGVQKDGFGDTEVRLHMRSGEIRHWLIKAVKITENEFAGFCLDTTELALRREEEKKNLLRLQLMNEILHNQDKPIQEFLDYMLEKLLQLSQSRIGYIYFYDENKKEFILNTWSKGVMQECTIQNPQTTYSLEKTGIWGEAVRQRKPIVVNDFEAPNDLQKGYPSGHAKLEKFMTVPIFNGASIVAVVGLANKKTPYIDSDVAQTELLMTAMWEIVERKRTEDKLFLQDELYSKTLLAIGDGVISTDRYGRITLMNPIAEQMTGWKNDDAIGKNFQDVFLVYNQETMEPVECPVQRVLKENHRIFMGEDAILVSRDGLYQPVEDSASPIYDADGNLTGVVVVFKDCSERREKQKRILFLSMHDQLTGLYNRHFFQEELARLDDPRQYPLTIVMGDVNGLKLTNDAFGHALGDELLKAVANGLKEYFRASDLVCRMGGDEFVILLPQTKEEDAKQIISRIHEAFSAKMVGPISISVSFGYASKTIYSESILDVLKKAEDMMYRGKLLKDPTNTGDLVHQIMSSLHSKSRREKEHSVRTSELCERISRRLGFSEEEIEKYRLSCMFHDIGKIAIDGSILEKKGPLSEEEWIEIKRHPEVGYRILCSIPELSEIAENVLCHHEHWDGTGYPRGLKGEQIPSVSRIIAVVDAYDVMSHERPYRKAMTKNDILAELERSAGTQFDPKTVQIVIENI